MSGINRVVLVGHLTKDPELRHTQGGTAVCEFAVAINSREEKDGEWGDRVDFFDVTVWAEQAEACAQYLAKGKLVGVDGRLRQDRWEKDGQKRSKVAVTATTVQFLPHGGASSETGGTSHAPAAATGDDDFGPSSDDDSIPF